jgi:protein tyrosine/serine phosphatase
MTMATYSTEELGAAPQHEIDWNFPLWSEILSGLWLGGTDDFDTIDYEANTLGPRAITKNDFEVVVTLYAWARPVDWFVEEVRYGFYDDNSSFDEATLMRAAKYAHEQWKSGKNVLVRCQAGINRSGLTMGIVLMLEGYTAEQAIELMRTKRSSAVLINQSFEKYLRELKLND